LFIAKSLNFIGHRHYLNHDFANAISHLELAIEFNPNHGPAHYNLGSAYEKLDDLAKIHEEDMDYLMEAQRTIDYLRYGTP
jgi:tetratricopeptide (TPR) repeat protein